MVPTIARGVKLGEGGEILTPHFRHGTKSSTEAAVLLGDINFRRVNTEQNEAFGFVLSHLRPGDKIAVKKTGDRTPFYPSIITEHLFTVHKTLSRTIGGPTPLLFSAHYDTSVSCPTLKGDDGWATEQEIGAT